MIVDCFTFFNEFDVLELRLRTLEDAVDRFVLCEAPFTFRGVPKPLYFAAAAERFARWRERLTVLTYGGPPSANPWQNEWGQRDFLATALGGCAPEDLVLIGDCDEIPDPQLAGRRPSAGRILGHNMMFSSGFVNRVAADGAPVWIGTRATTVAGVAAYGGLSNVRNAPVDALELVAGGWHFTSLGGPGVMQEKMQAYSHYEYDIPYFRDRRRLELQFRTSDYRWLPLDARFPHPLHDDPRWQRYVLSAPMPSEPENARELEHAHGCFAYVPPGAATVAVIAPESGAWCAAGRERFGTAFRGVFGDAQGLLARAEAPAWVVIDGFQRQPAGVLNALATAHAAVVLHVENARSHEVFERLIHGTAGFPAGRALGRAECEAEIRRAGYRIAAVDRVFTRKLTIPVDVPAGEPATIGSFVFARITPDGLYDFLADALLFALAPPSG